MGKVARYDLENELLIADGLFQKDESCRDVLEDLSPLTIVDEDIMAKKPSENMIDNSDKQSGMEVCNGSKKTHY